MRFWVLLLLWLAAAGPVLAAAEPPSPEPKAVIAQAQADLRDIGAGLDNHSLDDGEIDARLTRISAVRAHLAAVLNILNMRSQSYQSQLSALAPARARGHGVEDARAAAVRRNLSEGRDAVLLQTRDARQTVQVASQLDSTLSERLRENFQARLWARSRSILDPRLWRDFATHAVEDAALVAAAVGADTFEDAIAAQDARTLALSAAELLLGLFLLVPGPLLLARIGYRRAAADQDRTRLRRLLLAIWLVATAGVLTLLAGLLIRESFNQLAPLPAAADRIASLVIQTAVFAALVEALGRALMSPGRPEWRVAPIPDDMVRRLAPFSLLVAAANALGHLVRGLDSIVAVSQPTRAAMDGISVLLELAAVGGALTAIGRARAARRRGGAPAAPSAAESESRLPLAVVALAAWGAITVAAAAMLIGYLDFASFLMREMIWVGAILAGLSILLRLADDLFPVIFSPKAAAASALEIALGVSESTMEQTGVLLSGITRLALFVLAWAAVLAHFGAGPEDVFRRFSASDFVVRLGLVSISPTAVLGGIALFVGGLALTRSVRHWLEHRYLPKTALDVGLQNSLASAVTYLGALIALLVAFAYLGLTFAQIALLASALSVGIGFGLQSIIGNFVSGIVLLAERPIRVNDWIAIGDLEGDVKKISIRATEIEMMDHSRLIVPNSDLISKTVRNITHSGALGRVRIVLKVDAAADPTAVRDILLARLRGHPKVLKEPAAGVYMTDVRDGALEFTAFAYLSSPRLAYGVKSELLFQIVPDLKAAGVALYNQATVVNLGLGDRLIEPAPADPEPEPPPVGA